MAQYQSFPDAAGDSRTLEKLKALRLPEMSGKRFLDVGCNEGFFCGFADYQGAAKSVGLDHSEGFIKRARVRFPNCEFHPRGWEHLPDGPFDVVLLASALHYADDQPALIDALMERVSENGTLVLELGIFSSPKPVWTKVKRGIDDREFPSMPMVRKILAKYAWKWMGPSILQDGDPVPRHVIHISRRRPVVYLLMEPPGFGKSSIAAGLFPKAKVNVISGDHQISLVAAGKHDAPERLRNVISKDYSPFHLDRITHEIFDGGLAGELVSLWLAQAKDKDLALDVFVPPAYHDEVKRLLEERGYLPVHLSWDRSGAPPLAAETIAERAEAFYLSMLSATPVTEARDSAPKTRWDPAGFVDELSIEGDQLRIRGWAVDEQGALPAKILIKLGRKTIKLDTPERQLRPDVQRHLGLPHALVGYSVCVAVPGAGTVADLGRDFKVYSRGGATFKFGSEVSAALHQERS